MKEKQKTNEVYFHEESHIYFDDKQNFERYSASYEKNKYKNGKLIDQYNNWTFEQRKRWNPIPSVTTILQEVFQFNDGIGFIENYTKKIEDRKIEHGKLKDGEDLLFDNIYDTVNHIKEIFNEDGTMARNLGTEAHNQIETWMIKKDNKIKGNSYYLKLREQLELFGDFEYVDSETQIAHKELRYAGTFDGLIKLPNGEYALIDFKTGARVKYDKIKKVNLQLAAYHLLAKTKYPNIKITKHICISAYEDRKSGFEVRGESIYFDVDNSIKYWMKTIEVYELMKEIKKYA